MDFLLPLILTPLLALAFAILTNLYREHRKYSFELKPNCLLTRKPVVFLTGPRSIFYFRKFWNGYPEILAEHGYEVFTLPLPWRRPERASRMTDFLKKQSELRKTYHFIIDPVTATELQKVLENSPATASLTILEDHQETPLTRNPHISHFLGLSYKLHTWLYVGRQLPKAADLGLNFPTSSHWLLQEMQKKAEQDYLA